MLHIFKSLTFKKVLRYLMLCLHMLLILTEYIEVAYDYIIIII